MVQIGVEREGFRPSYRPAKQAAGMDKDIKRLGVVAACIGGGIALLAGGSSLLGHRHRGVPVIEADAGPVRIKPTDAGGMQVTGADLGLGVGSAQTLAPVAEQPQINALRAQLHAVKKELARQAAETAQVAKLAEANSVKVVAAPPVQRASAVARVPVAVALVALPKVADGPRVQLAAFTDEAAARTGWNALEKKAPDLLGGRAPEISRVQVAGHVMWRLRTGGFDSVAEATGFCGKMRAHGTDCAIAAF